MFYFYCNRNAGATLTLSNMVLQLKTLPMVAVQELSLTPAVGVAASGRLRIVNATIVIPLAEHQKFLETLCQRWTYIKGGAARILANGGVELDNFVSMDSATAFVRVRIVASEPATSPPTCITDSITDGAGLREVR